MRYRQDRGDSQKLHPRRFKKTSINRIVSTGDECIVGAKKKSAATAHGKSVCNSSTNATGSTCNDGLYRPLESHPKCFQDASERNTSFPGNEIVLA